MDEFIVGALLGIVAYECLKRLTWKEYDELVERTLRKIRNRRR